MVVETRVLGFAGSAVAIQWCGPEAERLVSFLFGAVPEIPPAAPHITFHLESGPAEGEIQLACSDPTESLHGPFGQVALHLMERVTFHLADRSQGGSLFHAACVSQGEKSLLLPGASGAGKSSLAIWLSTQGFQYRTDELVFIPSGSQECQTFPRPVHLKPSARNLFPDLLEKSALPIEPGPVGAPSGWLIPPGALGAAAQPLATQLHGIIFPRYTPGAGFLIQPLSKASAALGLAELLVNARNLPDNGFPELLRLARAVHAYRLTYEHFDPVVLSLQEKMQ